MIVDSQAISLLKSSKKSGILMTNGESHEFNPWNSNFNLKSQINQNIREVEKEEEETLLSRCHNGKKEILQTDCFIIGQKDNNNCAKLDRSKSAPIINKVGIYGNQKSQNS